MAVKWRAMTFQIELTLRIFEYKVIRKMCGVKKKRETKRNHR